MSKNIKISLTPVDEALATLLGQATELNNHETLSLIDAQGRILAEDKKALIFQPPVDNSAMDGYAVNTQDVSSNQPFTLLPIQQRIAAGDAAQALVPGTAARIFTGAMVPAGADAVVMQEQCEEHEGGVGIPQGIKISQNIRFKGEDFKEGQTLISKGSLLRPMELGLLAAMGFSKVCVSRPLKVMVLSTGDELVEPGESLSTGQIYNSNRYTLAGLLKAMGCEYLDGGIIEDDFDITKQRLLSAAQQADVVITSGGVSVGEEDHVKNALEEIGQLTLWKLAIKPGKPLAYGEIHNADLKTPFFGLPGNPAAVLVTFAILVRPYLLKMLGATELAPSMVVGKAGFERTKPSIRREYLRARLEVDDANVSVITTYPSQSSGMLRSASWANGFAIVDANQTVAAGDLLSFIPFQALTGSH
ncbi:MAG: molybdopterin molybdotransferase MoeA [Pseudomonadales bacterium]|nr:molybdopterin molybdotransferase MoeA [Pseudomonadales bacterium]